MTNYFELLDLPISFMINPVQLDKQYFGLQVKYHPDRAMNQEQKQQFQDLSVQINEAYENLKDDFKRSKAVLHANGIVFDDNASKNLLTELFLDEMFIEFERVEMLKDSDMLSEILADNYLTKRDLISELQKAFTDQNFQSAMRFTAQLRYIDNLIDKIKNKLQSKFRS